MRHIPGVADGSIQPSQDPEAQYTRSRLYELGVLAWKGVVRICLTFGRRLADGAVLALTVSVLGSIVHVHQVLREAASISWPYP